MRRSSKVFIVALVFRKLHKVKMERNLRVLFTLCVLHFKSKLFEVVHIIPSLREKWKDPISLGKKNTHLVRKLEENPRLDWTDLIPMVEMAYNGYHRSIGVSPYQCTSGSQSNTIASSAKGGLCEDFEDDDVDSGDGGNGDIVSDCNGNDNDDSHAV